MADPSSRGGGLSQVLRALLGLAFPYLLLAVPSDIRFTAPLVAGGTLLYILARLGTLFEPETLRRGSSATIGEAILVSLAVAMSLVLLAEDGLANVGIGGGVVLVVVYLLLHAIALPMLAALRSDAMATAPARPGLRRFIYAGAFLAEEAIALMCIGLAVHGHVVARQGPWGLWDITPVFPVVLLAFCYFPVLKLESAAHPRLSAEQSNRAAFEGMLLQLGAVLVAALTGAAPLL